MTNNQPQTLARQAEATVRRMILSGYLKPGEQIDKFEIADIIKCSIEPVRTALRILEREGLVEMRPRHGSFVAATAVGDISAAAISIVRRLGEAFRAGRTVDEMWDAVSGDERRLIVAEVRRLCSPPVNPRDIEHG